MVLRLSVGFSNRALSCENNLLPRIYMALLDLDESCE